MFLALALACTDYEYAELGFSDWYTQPSVGDHADVLFVVDDSASMAEEQDRLALNFAAFATALADSYADFQIAVTTTDPGRLGELSGPVLDVDTPGLEAAFADAVQVGTDGSRDEEGFTAAVAALEMNTGLVRSDSRVHVIFLSDEDDHSAGSVQDFVDELAWWGEADFRVHGIVGDLPTGCASGQSAASAGTRYVTAIEATEGFRDSICVDDYSPVLERIALQVIGWNDTFVLGRLPDPDTLVVWVDGVQMPERDVDGWTYAPGDNAVRFHGRSVPRPGMEIVVEYLPLLGS